MIANEHTTTDPTGSSPGDGPGPYRDPRLEALDERVQRALARGEERLRREMAAYESELQRARDRVERQLARAASKIEEHDRRIRDGRHRVIVAARALFLEKGYLAVSMQQIADAAGLRKASIYHHFRDKEALFADIVLQEFEANWGRLLAIIDEERPLAEALFTIAEEQLKSSTTDVGRLFMDFQKFVPESQHEAIHAKLKEMVDASARLFQRAIERGEIEAIDPRVAALFFFHMTAAWTFHGMEDPSILPPDPQTGARTVVNVLLHGLGARFTPAP